MALFCPPPRCHNVYDPRLRELVFHTGDIAIARDLGVPRSTCSDWRNGKFRVGVVTLDVFDRDMADLHVEVVKFRRRLRVCKALVGLLVAMERVFGLRLVDHQRLPEGKHKVRLLRAVARARKSLPLKAVLKVTGLSTARYHSRQRAQVKCELDDRPSCPKTQPTRICADEIQTIHDMATSDDYRHLPISRLTLLAQRLGKVFASAATWGKLIREHGWRRPRQRVYPAKAKVGVRAERPERVLARGCQHHQASRRHQGVHPRSDRLMLSTWLGASPKDWNRQRPEPHFSKLSRKRTSPRVCPR